MRMKKNQWRRRSACISTGTEEQFPDTDLSGTSAFRESRQLLLFRRISLSRRLNAAGILLSLVPLLIVGIVSYTRGSQTITSMAEQLVTQSITQTAKVISSKLQVIINDGVEIAYSDLVQESLPKYDSRPGWRSCVSRSRCRRASTENIFTTATIVRSCSIRWKERRSTLTDCNTFAFIWLMNV